MVKHTLKILRCEQSMFGHFTTLCMKGLNEFKNCISTSKILRNIMFEIFWNFNIRTKVKCQSAFSEVYFKLSSFVIVYLRNCIPLLKHLQIPSCKLYNNKYMIVSTQIANTEIFAFIALLILKLLSRKVLFINRKDNRNC